MKKLTIENGFLFLDGEKIPCLKKYNIAGSANDKGIAELTICMDVIIRDSELIESMQK